MGTLTDPMQRLVRAQRLGYIATVCPDGTPTLAPKGAFHVWDDEHLVFADIRSPGTIRNLRRNPAIEINVVDPFARKGYRFKGTATILEAGPAYERAVDFYRRRGSVVSLIREIVLIRVLSAQAIDSPAYDIGMTEAEVRDRWDRHFQSLRAGTHVGLAEELANKTSPARSE